MSYKTKLLICGTGNATHVLAGIACTKPDIEVRVLTQNASKVEQWTTAMSSNLFKIIIEEGDKKDEILTTKPFMVTNQPERAVPGSDIVILAMPAFGHASYLATIEPHLDDGVTIVGMPGQNGFEFDVRNIAAPRLKTCIVVNFESLPWICSVIEFGKIVHVSGTKEQLSGSIEGDVANAKIKDPMSFLQYLLGTPPTLIESGHILGVTLMSVNAYCHPTIMYGRWKEWDGKPLDEPALFYEGVDEDTGELMNKVSAEVVAISKAIIAEYPQVDLSQVIPVYQWDLAMYGNIIKDKTSMATVLRTNPGYEGITHPMIKTENGKYVPDFNHRFLTEDIPFGLVPIRGIAEIVGVKTPYIDTVLLWSQEKIGKEYLVGTRLEGEDLSSTRCPQRYGFTNLDDIIGFKQI